MVGQPKDVEGRNVFGGGAWAWTTSACSIAPRRCRRANASTGPTARPGWRYRAHVLAVALELASEDPAYEDVASKFFEHFVAIVDAHDDAGRQRHVARRTASTTTRKLDLNETRIPVRLRSCVGLHHPARRRGPGAGRARLRLPGFAGMNWFLENRQDPRATPRIASREQEGLPPPHASFPRGSRLGGSAFACSTRASSCRPTASARCHGYTATTHACSPSGRRSQVQYMPAEGNSDLFGGNSNWRRPVWFPRQLPSCRGAGALPPFYGDTLQVECPSARGKR